MEAARSSSTVVVLRSPEPTRYPELHSKLMSLVLKPFYTFSHHFGELLAGPNGIKRLILVLVGLLLGWWIYVPLHEFLHVAGCLLGGGQVATLHLDPLYGGHIFASLFSFVSAGGDYAGRLTNFDTGGSDWVYALTVYSPFFLTLPGFQLLKWSGNSHRSVPFGLAVPFAFAPVISLTGDFLELGSLTVFQAWQGIDSVHRSLVSDDLFRLIGELGEDASTLSLNQPGVIFFIALSVILGIGMAWLTLIYIASETLTADWGRRDV